MVAILRGLAAAAPGAIHCFHGIGDVLVQDDDIVIPEHVAERIATMQALTIYEQIPVSAASYAELSARMISRVPASLRELEIPSPGQIRIADGYGRLTDLDAATGRLTAATRDENAERQVLVDHLLPCMHDKFDARFVTAVSTNVDEQEKLISLTKILMLAGRFGLAEGIRRRHLLVLSGILPSCLSALGFVDSVTRFPPLFLTLPIYHLGLSWHFQSDAMWNFGNVPMNGIGSHVAFHLSPLCEGAHNFGLQGLVGMNEAEVWRYLEFAVHGVNRLLAFANDFRSFSAADGSVDLVRKCQAYGAINLIFADLLALGSVSGAYNRISYAMSILDKLANLRTQLKEFWTGEVTGERDAFKALLSASQRDQLKILITRRMRSMNYDTMAGNFEVVVDRCYQTAWDEFAGMTEQEFAARVWSQRNMRHGTFLQRQQFENVFFDSRGIVPDSLATVAFVLVLGLMSAPREFLEFSPAIAVPGNAP